MKLSSKNRFLASLIVVLMLCLSLTACSGTQTASTGSSTGSNAGSVPVNTTSTSNNNASTNSGTTNSGQPLASTNQQPPANGSQSQLATGAPLQPTGNLPADVKNVVKSALPAVVLVAVNIESQDVFGRTQQGQGVGTGSIITPDGFIVTNNHVVEGGTNIQVALNDGRRLPARLIGRDPSNDVAVIKIDGQNFPTIKIGDSSKLEVADYVVAIGNALGLQGGPSVTTGVVSAVKRSITEPNGISISDLIQTDAAINPGNSGGPLLNLNGEMIGINTAGATGSADEPAQNIGFALSINSVRPIIEGFMSGKQVSRPYMGVSLTNVTPTVATRYGLQVNSGVLITQVAANTPAAKAGFKAGDTIVEMDGTKVNETADLSTILSRHKAGDTVNVTLVDRSGKQRAAQITFSAAPNTGG